MKIIIFTGLISQWNSMNTTTTQSQKQPINIYQFNGIHQRSKIINKEMLVPKGVGIMLQLNNPNITQDQPIINQINGINQRSKIINEEISEQLKSLETPKELITELITKDGLKKNLQFFKREEFVSLLDPIKVIMVIEILQNHSENFESLILHVHGFITNSIEKNTNILEVYMDLENIKNYFKEKQSITKELIMEKEDDPLSMAKEDDEAIIPKKNFDKIFLKMFKKYGEKTNIVEEIISLKTKIEKNDGNIQDLGTKLTNANEQYNTILRNIQQKIQIIAEKNRETIEDLTNTINECYKGINKIYPFKDRKDIILNKLKELQEPTCLYKSPETLIMEYQKVFKEYIEFLENITFDISLNKLLVELKNKTSQK